MHRVPTRHAYVRWRPFADLAADTRGYLTRENAVKTVWSKVPSRWIRDGGLHAFRANGDPGDAAALKLYMAFAMFASFRASPTAPAAGAVRLSFSELERLCDISRRYITHGLRCLAANTRISIDRVGKAHRYVLADYEETGWAKLPRAHLLADQRFQGVGIRGARHLDALKLYLALVSFRANHASQALLSYDRIEHYTGIARPVCGELSISTIAVPSTGPGTFGPGFCRRFGAKRQRYFRFTKASRSLMTAAASS